LLRLYHHILTAVCTVIDRWRHVRMRSRVSSLLRFWSCCLQLVILEHALRDCHPLTRYIRLLFTVISL